MRTLRRLLRWRPWAKRVYPEPEPDLRVRFIDDADYGQWDRTTALEDALREALSG